MSNKITLTHVSYLALVSGAAGAVLMFVRFVNLMSFSEPLQITASGAEYESLYVIWKYINGWTVFSDHLKIPFAGTFYNWAYYAFYGEIVDIGLRLFNLDDAWIPTLTKVVSLLGLIYGTWIAYLCFSQISPLDNNIRRLNLAFALLVFFGPLMGFFGIATAPDVWALAFDITAILFFLKYFGSQPLKAILLACVFAYLAWGFKQIFVFTPGIIGLYLLLKREWKWLIIFSSIMWAGWGITLFIGGEQYTKAMLQFGGTKITLDPDRFVRNVSNGLPKLIAPLMGLIAILVVYIVNIAIGKADAADQRKFGKQQPLQIAWLALLGITVAAVIAIPASAKQGAAENYYFTLSFFLSFALVGGTVWCLRIQKLGGFVLSMIAAGWIINLVGVGSVLAGINGKLSNYYIHIDLAANRDCLAKLDLPKPAFVGHQYLALPWMYPADQHFVIQTSYRWDRKAGVEMEGGGIGGLIDQGYFASLILAERETPDFDGSDLSRYELQGGACKGFVIYKRKL